MSFNRKYFTVAIIIFLVEVMIALYVQDSFVRPYLGDVLVVILLYCLLKSFIKIPVKNAIFGVLLFSVFIEILQYIKITKLLKLQNDEVISIVLGSDFEWLDITMYVCGALFIFFAEQLRPRGISKT